jgi:hypothetical protein
MTDQPQHNSDKRAKASNPEHKSGNASSDRDKTYEFFEKHDHYWIARHRKNTNSMSYGTIQIGNKPAGGRSKPAPAAKPPQRWNG